MIAILLAERTDERPADAHTPDVLHDEHALRAAVPDPWHLEARVPAQTARPREPPCEARLPAIIALVRKLRLHHLPPEPVSSPPHRESWM